MTDIADLRSRIEASWAKPSSVDINAVEEAVECLDKGLIRAAEPDGNGGWQVNEWVKQSILLYFRTHSNQTVELPGGGEYHDKVPTKNGYADLGVRVVPPGTARYGSYLAPGVVLMPGYVNIGAYVGDNTMVDTWATVGSCAQIGANVHLAGGVGIGGVLEPLQASPVIVEDGAFIGSRCIVVEGARIGANAVLGANVVITKSTPVIDVTQESAVEYRGEVPAGAIVIPGTRSKEFPAGTYSLPTGLIIGWRSAETEDKVQLNNILREHGIAT